MFSFRFAIVGIALAVASTGCETITLSDDVNTAAIFKPIITPFTGPYDTFNSPYVVGASFNLVVNSSNNDQSMTGWQIVSSDPAVLQVSALQTPAFNGSASTRATALSDGQVTLTVITGSGSVMHRATAEVRIPDNIKLFAAGWLHIDVPAARGLVNELRIRAGGQATYLARYFIGEKELNGHGTLTVDPVEGVEATVARSYLFEDRDWLQVTPSTPCEASLGLRVAGTPVIAVPLVAVDEKEIELLSLLGSDESKASENDWLAVLGQAFDGAGRSIYGVEFTWDVDDKRQQGYGDLYEYQYIPGNTKTLRAAYGSKDVSGIIHAGEGHVHPSNLVGCSAVPGQARASAGSIAFLAAVLLLGGFLRRGRKIH